MAHGHERGLKFELEGEQRILNFYSQYLRHSKGEWAGQLFTLDLWQQFIVGSMFGWKRRDGFRRFRSAYAEVPRKNGKSTLCSGISLYALTADGEPGAEVYSAATKKTQAAIVFNEARNMVLASEELRARVRTFKWNMNVPATLSKFEPLGSDSDSLDGLNIHCNINDELHAWRDHGLMEVIDTAMGSRRQPIQFNITTAGQRTHGICWELRELAIQILRREIAIEDGDSIFAYIATIDKGDNWDDPDTWRKANPGFGKSVKINDLQDLAAKARHLPRALAAFKRLRLNIWTSEIDAWLPAEKWVLGGGPINEAELEGRSCFVGVDLSSNTDVTAAAFVFPPRAFDPDEVEKVISMFDPNENGELADFDPDELPNLNDWHVLWRYYLPAENLAEKAEADQADYVTWAAQGHLCATPGNVVDYDYIVWDIEQMNRRFRVREVAVDRWGATHMMTMLGKRGFEVVPFGQGFASMSSPSKYLEGLVYSGKLKHGDHPVSAWMAGNVVPKEDDARNIKPIKGKSRGRIDGIVAMIMGIGRAIAPRDPEDEEDETYVYTGL